MSPKLYSFRLAVWGAVAELAVAELAVPVEHISVSLADGDNFSPEYLKINPAGTVPTLVTEDGTTYYNSTDIVKYLVSVAQRKATPGNPKTIAIVHEDRIDPNVLMFALRNDDELAKAKSRFTCILIANRYNALKNYAASPEGAPYSDFYTSKFAFDKPLLDIYNDEASPSAWYAHSIEHWKRVVSFINDELSALLPESGFIGGDEPGEDDFHLGAWLTRVVWLAGATKDPEGLKPIEKELGGPVPPKVVKYWQAWLQRPSFQKVYEKTLH
ncbi:thioredoxin-like protein [Trametopsis cervina]|nr:thioredoxin-like protein [Trametopsis cervina]